MLYCFSILYKVVLAFHFVDKIQRLDQLNESYLTVLSRDIVYNCCTK